MIVLPATRFRIEWLAPWSPTEMTPLDHERCPFSDGSVRVRVR